MSEEILKALTRLFAIITKQDGGVTEKERQFVIDFFQQELDQDSIKEYLELYDEFVGYKKKVVAEEASEQGGGEEEEEKPAKKRKLTSVRDSVKTLALCKKINKTLTQKQKAVVLVKILELVSSEGHFTPQRMEIIDTISSVFNIVKDEFKLIESFVLKENVSGLQFDDILLVNNQPSEDSLTATEEVLQTNEGSPVREESARHFNVEVDGNLIFMKVNSTDMYFVKYLGHDEIVLNGFIMLTRRAYLFSNGSTIKTPVGDALYYSDVITHFVSDLKISPISFNAQNIEFKFPNGGIGLRNVNISEYTGKLIGIMGGSGTGKTTLLNVLSGMEQPSKGQILINGYNTTTQKDKLQGVIGYIAQDDLLIEELTVYENLYYNAKLCFADLKEKDLDKRVMDVLTSLGLDQRKDLKVGSVLDKTISGGQRKRLNIALELIREPAILFVDEPTSGLSSRDSENVIDLLKELSLKGKLIFVVIHQPSSDIYKMFDKMYIMDTGGYPIFYGNPIHAVTYFKEVTHQVDAKRGQCETCGNVNPEQIFNIIEAKVVDEYGQLTNRRKINPTQWSDFYSERFTIENVEDVHEKPPRTLSIPSRIKQTFIFTIRDTIAKLGNKQYLMINLLEAPLLALILAFIIRYKNSSSGTEYIFRENDNIPAFMLMSIVVSLFMGLTVSAEEIIRDRKILKRESFLNLSWNSYLLSKLTILFTMSAIQTMSFVLIGNLLLEIHGMTFGFWLVLFTVSCMANVMGLNISSAFNSAVTVYVIIPLLLVPQMILSGLLFNFDKLNSIISTKGKVPFVADMMASRWAYEAMAVYQFKENDFEKPYYRFEESAMKADFKSSYLVKELKRKLDFVNDNISSSDDSVLVVVQKHLAIVKYELRIENFKKGIEEMDLDKALSMEGFNDQVHQLLIVYLNNLKDHYINIYNLSIRKKEKLMNFYEKSKDFDYNINDYKDRYFNESLSDLVRNVAVKERLLEYDGKLIQQINPIFNTAEHPTHLLDYRAHFFAPRKHLFGTYFDTYYFNIVVIWFMTVLLYVSLYYEFLRKIIHIFSKVNILKAKG